MGSATLMPAALVALSHNAGSGHSSNSPTAIIIGIVFGVVVIAVAAFTLARRRR